MNNQDNKPLGDNQQNSNQIGNLSIFEGKSHHAYFHEKIQKLLIAILSGHRPYKRHRANQVEDP